MRSMDCVLGIAEMNLTAYLADNAGIGGGFSRDGHGSFHVLYKSSKLSRVVVTPWRNLPKKCG